jgi:hypothetical protein
MASASEPQNGRSTISWDRQNLWRASPVAALCLVAIAFLFATLTEERTPSVVEPIVQTAPAEPTVVAGRPGEILDRLREAQAGKWAILPSQVWEFADKASALAWFDNDKELVAGTDEQAAAAETSKSAVVSSDGHLAFWLVNPTDGPLVAILIEAGTGGCDSGHVANPRWLAVWISKSPLEGGQVMPHKGAILFAPVPAGMTAEACASIRQIYTYQPGSGF